MHKHIVLLNDKTIIELDFAKYRDLPECLADQSFASAFGIGK